MKLKFKVPLFMGILLFVVAFVTGFQAIWNGAQSLKKVIQEEIQIQNESNSELIYEKLNVELGSLENLSYTDEVMSMDWTTIQPYLLPYIKRNNISNMALVQLNGDAVYVLNNESTNLMGRNYFNAALNGQTTLEVVFSRISNNLVMMFITPIFNDNKVVGALLMRKNAEVVLSAVVSNLNLSWSTGINYIINLEGSVLYHPNSEYTKTMYNVIENGGTWGDFVAGAVQKKRGSEYYVYEGINRLSVFSEIPLYNWVLITSVERNEINSLVRKDLPGTIILGLSLIFIGIIVVIFLSRMITKPLSQIDAIMEYLGQGDLSRSIEINSKDEYGHLSGNINRTIKNLKNLVQNVKDRIHDLQAIGDELTSNMNETAASVNEMTSNIQSIKQRIINQSASVTETHATMEQITQNINKLDKNVVRQSENVSDSSAAIEEMVANIKSVTNTLIKNNENVVHLKNASQTGKDSVNKVANDIKEISKESEGLMEINSVMENIAAQTNLLSMNAAIEAAHAGDSGKGFAVVANEIRKLAENSQRQSNTIKSVLKKIKSNIDKITVSTSDVLTKFDYIDDSVKVVAEQEHNIRTSMEEQEVGSQQILQGVSVVTVITKDIEAGSSEMLEGSSEVIREAENLEKATQEIKSGINEMATGADQINIAVHEVNEISIKTKDIITAVTAEVSKFKL